MSKKALYIGFGAVAATGIAALIATGFIHEEKGPTPDECMQAMINDAPKALNAGAGGAVMLANTPEAKQAAANFQDCMTRAADAQNGWSFSFGWK